MYNFTLLNMTKQFIICKNDSPEFSLPFGTTEETAQALLQKIKREQGEEDSNGFSIYWLLREVELLELEQPKQM